ncbi:MAG: type II toxin-antitoxin system Phd/YefM family antitoxin [Candidatus Melainabacteria bacterium]|nr:type II toxin-antitoxin system Phd/YefM family antitoxin [Candidatus Melainabacteria bacterium]
MAQQEPEPITVKEILKLVDQLSPEDHEQLVQDMKLQWLRREVQKGIEQADRGELINGDDVFAELKQRFQSKSDQK